jgi:deazaflavin-dependent oxidoreductase (nitroreductase family)
MTGAVGIVGALLAGGALLLVAFTVGFRTKFAPLHAAIRRFNRDVTNPRQLQRAGRPGAWASVVHHVGRSTGTPYRTPVVALPIDDGFLFALPYGPRADWVRNVLAAGSTTVQHDGRTYRIAHPKLVSADDADHVLPRKQQRMHRIYGVEDLLVVDRTDSE